MGLEIFNAGGGWRDQKWAPSWSVKLPSLRQGRVQTLPCSLGRQSARSSSLERGKPRLSALKRRVRLSCFTCLRCAGSLVLFPAPRGGEIVRFVCPTEWGRFCIFPCLQGRGDLRFP
ncbi:Stereoselective keto-reductase [Trichinella spiralis]